jgi:sulfite reductase alpha subunit-like flavoprotein
VGHEVTTSAPEQSRAIQGHVGKMDSPTALVLYGSETGNAQDIAQELVHLCERLHFTTSICPLDAVKIVRT